MTLRRYKHTLVSTLCAALSLVGCSEDQRVTSNDETVTFNDEIKIGVIHSQTGTMAASEDSALSGLILAIEDINRGGGITIEGKKLRLVPIIEDARSDADEHGWVTESLLGDSEIKVVFGGWTSSGRKAMTPLFSSGNALLFYSIQYEGGENAPHVFYLGPTPEQQSLPAIDWFLAQGHRDFFLLGSSYIYPITANKLFRKHIEAAGGHITGEEYVFLGQTIKPDLIEKIRASMPTGGVILNTVNGDSNESLFREMNRYYLNRKNGYFSLSFSIDESSIDHWGAKYFEDAHLSQGFFEDSSNDKIRSFMRKYKNRYGAEKKLNDAAVTSYVAVHMWAQAVERASTTDPQAVEKALIGSSYEGPLGTVQVNENRHLTREIFIGQVNSGGTIEVLKSFGQITPEGATHQ